MSPSVGYGYWDKKEEEEEENCIILMPRGK